MMMFLNLQVLRKDTSRKYKYYDNKTNKIIESSKRKAISIERKNRYKNWNILCRWALCYSLYEDTVPTDIPINTDSNLEMSWYTFAGEYSELYEALIREWCIEKR